MTLRLAFAGFQHETNTFVATPTTRSDFEAGGTWPGLCRGPDMVSELLPTRLPMGGALSRARSAEVEIVPLLWCFAQPSGRVARDAFEAIAGAIVDGIAAAAAERAVDGVYLDLHGAMVTDDFEDGEGELLRRVREVVPPPVPVVVSLDYHANLTALMVRHASFIDIYRTYPHVDMHETGARALDRLLALASGRVPQPLAMLRQLPFLVEVTSQCTLTEPARSLIDRHIEADQGADLPWVAAAMGFPLADIEDAGPAVLAYTEDEGRAAQIADRLVEHWLEAEPALDAKIQDAAEVLALAERRADGSGRGPVIVADTQDNPGGGGSGDTPGLLRALIEARITGALVVHIADGETAREAHASGVGGRFAARIGGKVHPEFGPPVAGEAEVLALGDGRFTGIGPMSAGHACRYGACARLGIGGVEVIVAERKAQALEPGLLHHLGAELNAYRILVLKSSVHFRAAFQDLAREILIAAAPGPVTADLGALTYSRLRAGMRLAGGAEVKRG